MWPSNDLITFTILNAELTSVRRALRDHFIRHAMLDARSETEELADPNRIYARRDARSGRLSLVYTPASSTTSPVTVFMTSFDSLGWLELIKVLSGSISGRHVSVVSSSTSVTYPVQWFSIAQDGLRLRMVRVMKDPHWDFYEDGIPLDCENLVAYKKRRIKDRLTRESIAAYCREIAVDPSEPGFWRSPSHGIYFDAAGID
jgi:hypothetical protein